MQMQAPIFGGQHAGGPGMMSAPLTPPAYQPVGMQGRNPDVVSTYVTPDPSWCIGGAGPLSGLLIGGNFIPPTFFPYTSTLHGTSGKVRVYPFVDDYGDSWLVLLDGYDFAKLASFDRAAGAEASVTWNALRARNYAEQAWKRISDAYAAVIRDSDGALVLPDDPSNALPAPAGTPFSIVGNIPCTIPANPQTGAPALKMRLTGDRFLRLAYFSSNQEVRGQWDAKMDAWAAAWDGLKTALVFAVDVVTFNFGGALNEIDKEYNLGGLQDFQKYQQWLAGVLQADLSPNGPIQSPPGNNYPSVPTWLYVLGGAAVAGVLALLLLGGKKGS